mmetsp:Transcript_72149/g.172332  ORF Transcript_72149/g.172332 Transcript_72149/m.172332 type:complete len:226 (+) Transcript_72149:1953-2630(+)
MPPDVTGGPPWSMTNCVSVSLALPLPSQVPSLLTRRYLPVAADWIRSVSPSLAASSSPVVAPSTKCDRLPASEAGKNLVSPLSVRHSTSPLLFLMRTFCRASMVTSGLWSSVATTGSKVQNALGSKGVPLPSATPCGALCRKQPPFRRALTVMGAFSLTRGCNRFFTSANSMSECSAAKRSTTDFLRVFSTSVFVTLIIFFFLPMTRAALLRTDSYQRAMADAPR